MFFKFNTINAIITIIIVIVYVSLMKIRKCEWFIDQFANASVFYLKTIFIRNYIDVILTHSTRSKRRRWFLDFTNRVYKFALIIINDEISHAKRN